MIVASGVAWQMQPRYSPDGSQIAFTSDEGGGDRSPIGHDNASCKNRYRQVDLLISMFYYNVIITSRNIVKCKWRYQIIIHIYNITITL